MKGRKRGHEWSEGDPETEPPREVEKFVFDDRTEEWKYQDQETTLKNRISDLERRVEELEESSHGKN
jgi:hypothetical protein